MPGSAHGRKRGRSVTPDIKQLTPSERRVIDNMVRVKKASPTDALLKINEKRMKSNLRPVEKSCVHRFVKGSTHKLTTQETRGRNTVLTKKDINSLDQARRRLIRRADNDARVTYSDVLKEAGFTDKVSQRVCEDALRKRGVGYKAPRRKIYVTDEDAKERKSWATKKLKLPKRFWTEDVHAYQDSKQFPLPLTAKQRKRFRQTQVTGHLRKAGEGLDRGFTKPREAHSFLGLPSVNITAAVGKDKIFMWHVNGKSWCGAAAAAMYKDAMKPALVRKYGALKRFKIVEDGDRKGHYSNKGIAAKKAAGIYAIKLPPRTPSLMPLDFALWSRISKQLMDEAPEGDETKEVFLKRLRKIAMSLPKSYVKKVIARMRPNLKALKDAHGYTPKND